MSFRIRRPDERNWILEQLVPGGIHPTTRQPGQDRWEVVGYYGKLEDLARYLVDRQIEVPEGTLQDQIKGLLVELKAAEGRILEELKLHRTTASTFAPLVTESNIL